MLSMHNEVAFSDFDDAAKMIDDLMTPSSVGQVTNQTSDIEQVSEQDIDAILARRDKIVFYILSDAQLRRSENRANLAMKLNVSIAVLMKDLKALTHPDVWRGHKNRLKEQLIFSQRQAELLLENRKNEVTGLVLKFKPFTAHSIIDLTERFRCTPSAILQDINQLKCPKYWYTHHIAGNHSVVKKASAALKFARIHLTY
ncbi:hypothetical protein [Shewanella aestuarii]|uniref:Uncharacterized protein n=1 Tax=Shewanella aestuarii TaxID=1028752 RepID=A0A6G9QPV5_9GAMM|nr:hypothetical protein [Shewanella aestuarii]QIR16596.1 hypothetical protein HBH39_19160 [Shewanella aestuarii]